LVVLGRENFISILERLMDKGLWGTEKLYSNQISPFSQKNSIPFSLKSLNLNYRKPIFHGKRWAPRKSRIERGGRERVYFKYTCRIKIKFGEDPWGVCRINLVNLHGFFMLPPILTQKNI